MEIGLSTEQELISPLAMQDAMNDHPGSFETIENEIVADHQHPISLFRQSFVPGDCSGKGEFFQSGNRPIDLVQKTIRS